MRVLMIEDESYFVESVKDAFDTADDATLLLAVDVGVAGQFDHDGQESIEEQLGKRLAEVVEANNVDLVLLDTDLSRETRFQTQTVYRQAFRQIGVPVCRYRKKARESNAHNLELVYRLATDGSTAVYIPYDAVTGDGPEECLVSWLQSVNSGFKRLRHELEQHPDYLDSSLGPAGTLARLLGRPPLHPDLLGYTGPNVFFFGPNAMKTAQNTANYAVALGYWLVNYILAFPGPILHRDATAAFLNITVEMMDREDIRRLISAAEYKGPFAALNGGHYWAEDLAELVDGWDGDIANVAEIRGAHLDRVSQERHGRAFYCMVSRQPISEADAADSPDWIPPGAGMARINREDLEQLGPMLSI
ncbi:hypothetical protein [Luteibacter sp.]|uniref:hypothetical protein n=1 Tax=Luteibacter sp. TaxID=1886636 RepID=UPI00280990CA|nr:hypothetical protein [Luteibacter sp.]MDQ8048085.1 hypothetical protein [Luteibacter sp.]